jgi:hypothetical protein
MRVTSLFSLQIVIEKPLEIFSGSDCANDHGRIRTMILRFEDAPLMTYEEVVAYCAKEFARVAANPGKGRKLAPPYDQ